MEDKKLNELQGTVDLMEARLQQQGDQIEAMMGGLVKLGDAFAKLAKKSRELREHAAGQAELTKATADLVQRHQTQLERLTGLDASQRQAVN